MFVYLSPWRCWVPIEHLSLFSSQISTIQMVQKVLESCTQSIIRPRNYFFFFHVTFHTNNAWSTVNDLCSLICRSSQLCMGSCPRRNVFLFSYTYVTLGFLYLRSFFKWMRRQRKAQIDTGFYNSCCFRKIFCRTTLLFSTHILHEYMVAFSLWKRIRMCFALLGLIKCIPSINVTKLCKRFTKWEVTILFLLALW